jgi:hypothetical protein
MNTKTFITAVVVSLVSLGAADLMGVPVSGKVFAQTNHQSALANIITTNANDVNALRAALETYLVNNPDSGTSLSEAVDQANPGVGALRVIANAAKQAYMRLSRAGNQTASAALYNEVRNSSSLTQAQVGTSNYFTNIVTTSPNCASVSCS